MLTPENAVLIIVDVQGRLAQMMHGRDALFENLQKMISGAQALEVPILRAEQNPEGLGSTVPEIDRLLPDSPPISKMSFSCCGESRFAQALHALGRNQVLIAGIEAHVCVYQTTADLLAAGYEVYVVADAVSSRTAYNRQIALEAVRDLGAKLTSVEMALFELLRTAGGDAFRAVLKIVK